MCHFAEWSNWNAVLGRGISASGWIVQDSPFNSLVTPMGILLPMNPASPSGCYSPDEMKYWTGAVTWAICDRADVSVILPTEAFPRLWCRRRVLGSWVLVWALDTIWRYFGDSLRLIFRLFWWCISPKISGDVSPQGYQVVSVKVTLTFSYLNKTFVGFVLRGITFGQFLSGACWWLPLWITCYLTLVRTTALGGAIPVPSLRTIKRHTWYFSSSQQNCINRIRLTLCPRVFKFYFNF